MCRFQGLLDMLNFDSATKAYSGVVYGHNFAITENEDGLWECEMIDLDTDGRTYSMGDSAANSLTVCLR